MANLFKLMDAKLKKQEELDEVRKALADYQGSIAERMQTAIDLAKANGFDAIYKDKVYTDAKKLLSDATVRKVRKVKGVSTETVKIDSSAWMYNVFGRCNGGVGLFYKFAELEKRAHDIFSNLHKRIDYERGWELSDLNDEEKWAYDLYEKVLNDENSWYNKVRKTFRFEIGDIDAKVKTKQSAVTMAEKSLERVEEKIRNAVDAMEKEIPPALKGLQEKYTESFFKYYKNIAEKYKKIRSEFSTDKDFYDYLAKNRMPLYDTIYMKMSHEEIKGRAEWEASVLVANLYSSCVYYTGSVEWVDRMHIAENGELNGFVYGKRQGVNVRTIIAGGYNIQCRHYRVICTPVPMKLKPSVFQEEVLNEGVRDALEGALSTKLW